jgi:hypothetical protein
MSGQNLVQMVKSASLRSRCSGMRAESLEPFKTAFYQIQDVFENESASRNEVEGRKFMYVSNKGENAKTLNRAVRNAIEGS